MEDLGVSEHSGAVVKTKSSSGCLIVEKKAVTGVGGVSDSPSRKLFNSSEDKKRPRVVLTDSESSDELLDSKVRKIRKNLKECEDFQTEMVSNGLDESAVDNDESNLPLSASNENEEQNLDQRKDGVMKVIVNDNKQKESRTVKTVKRDRNAKKKMKNASSVNGKDSKHKRASCTEKQLLREKIKKMLFAAGWKIDYRPRRNRDYLDSVYISPSGSAYWSITKAYETLRKEEKSSSKAGDDFSNFIPLPNEILNKLTRQTRKKIEREIEKNRENEGQSRKSSSYKETPLKDGLILKKSAVRSSSRVVQGAKRKKNGRLTLLVRGSDTGLNSEDNGSVSLSYPKKRSLISWLIDSGIVSVGEKVEYMNLRKTRVMQEGWITEEGNIHCECCSKIITISRFELHAGSKLGQPFENVFLQSGQSLIQCQIDAWNEQKESERKGFHCVNIDCDDPNDDTCGICGDGGDLICCDGCPSTFHLSCLDMQMLPQGDWHCPNCVCKYCELVGVYSNKASGRTESSLLTCCLCEKKYHKSCSLEMGNRRIVSKDLNSSFCGKKCQELYNDLQKFLWVKHELDSGFSWSLIHRSDPLPDSTSVNFSQRVECNSKLAIALSVMDECFMPIIDGRSGITLIHNVVYNCGSNFSRLNFSGFFTAILERGDEIICAASIRIHGTQLAEMPFIGTRHLYRRQGMCRRLLQAIESALSFLKVEKLVIPAIEEHLHTWTNAFGFSPLEKAQRQEIRSVNMLVFPGTDMLQKLLTKQRTTKDRITSEKGKKVDYNKPLTKESESNPSMQNCNSSEHPSEHENRLSGEKPDAGSKDPVSVDAHSNSNSKPDAGSKDPVSIDAHSNSNSNVVHNGNAVNLLSPKSPNLPLEPDLQGKESAHSIQDENRNV